MGRIVSNLFMSLDGVVGSPEHWHFQYFNGQMAAAIGAGAAACVAFLVGRVLYEEWAGCWPGQLRIEPDPAQESADDVATFIDNVSTSVVSDTLAEATSANATVAFGDVAAKIQALKDRTDGQIGMSGSATLVRWLLANGLLEELNLMAHPSSVGHGQRLFEETPTHQLVRHEAFSTGVPSLSYVPAA